jgi:hypothetical protein
MPALWLHVPRELVTDTNSRPDGNQFVIVAFVAISQPAF